VNVPKPTAAHAGDQQGYHEDDRTTRGRLAVLEAADEALEAPSTNSITYPAA